MSAVLIQAAPVERDESGHWWHPDMPDFEEGQEQEWRDWITQQRLEVSRGLLEDERDDHPAYVAYFDKADPDFSAWADTPPEGDGWFTLAIFDAEDGPVWAWARRVVK
jgi:hypothetical protein